MCKLAKCGKVLTCISLLAPLDLLGEDLEKSVMGGVTLLNKVFKPLHNLWHCIYDWVLTVCVSMFLKTKLHAVYMLRTVLLCP